MACRHLRRHTACLLSCRYDSDDYSQFQIDQKTGDDWRKVYSTPEKHPCYDPSKVPDPSLREGCCTVDPTVYLLDVHSVARGCSQRPAAPSAAWCPGWPLTNACGGRRCIVVQ